MKTYSKTIYIKPMPRKRVTYQGRNKPEIKKYHAWCNEARKLFGKFDNPPVLGIDFYFPIPKSNKKYEQRIGKYHQLTPDYDNCFKAVSDALYNDDKVLCVNLGGAKYWGREGKIVITWSYDISEDLIAVI